MRASRLLAQALGIGAATALTVAPVLSHAADASFAVKLEVPPARKGVKGVAKIHIAPAAGYHMNRDYPTVVKLTEIPAGVTVDRLTQSAKDAVKFEEQGAEFDVPFTAQEAGQKVVTGELKFAVCSKTSCDPKKEKLSITIDVK
jgi:hypothetical protein